MWNPTVETIQYSVGGGAFGFHPRMRILCAPLVKHRSCGRRRHGTRAATAVTEPHAATGGIWRAAVAEPRAAASHTRPPRSQLARATTDEISSATSPELPRLRGHTSSRSSRLVASELMCVATAPPPAEVTRGRAAAHGARVHAVVREARVRTCAGRRVLVSLPVASPTHASSHVLVSLPLASPVHGCVVSSSPFPLPPPCTDAEQRSAAVPPAPRETQRSVRFGG